MASGDNLPTGELSNGDQARAIYETIQTIIYTSQAPDSDLGLDFTVPEVTTGLRPHFPAVYLAGDKTSSRPHISFRAYSTLEDYQSAPRPDLQPDCIFTGDPDQADNVFYKVSLGIEGHSKVDPYVNHHQVAWLRVEQTHADPNLPIVLLRSVAYEIWKDDGERMFIHHPEVDDVSRVDMGASAQLEQELRYRERFAGLMAKVAVEELLDELKGDPGAEPEPEPETKSYAERLIDFIFSDSDLEKDIQDARGWVNSMLEDRVDGLGLVTATEAQALELLTKRIAAA